MRELRRVMPDVGILSFEISSGGVETNNPATFSLELLWYVQPGPKPAKK
jgi:hypothetical protein